MTTSFGIISGAGPMAGVLLYRQIIELLQAKGAWQDADFPAIIIMNIPFSNMLGKENSYDTVRNELVVALQQLSKQVDYIYIACQTLHAFLSDEEIKTYHIISLFDLIKKEVTVCRKPILVAASSTSRKFNLHIKMDASTTINYIHPKESDKAIEMILRGLRPNLSWLIEKTFENTIVLGCTEFSVSCYGMGFQWIDPIQLAAIDVVKKFTKI